MSADITYLLDTIEAAGFSEDDREILCDCVGFVQGFHDLLADYGMIPANHVDVDKLESAYTALLGENAAAAIFLAARVSKSADVLMRTYEELKDNPESPPIVVSGYKNLANRVLKTRKELMTRQENEGDDA